LRLKMLPSLLPRLLAMKSPPFCEMGEGVGGTSEETCTIRLVSIL
jgi:hypothetical protein